MIRKIIAIFLSLTMLVTSTLSVVPRFVAPPLAYASNQCLAAAGGVATPRTARVGGVALDMAAKFLANMSDITGAYYDEGLDRIVFVGKKNVAAPQFDKDDMAVAIKTVIFNRTIPAVSMEIGDPDDNKMDVIMYGGIEDTRFGKVLLDADWKLKQYSSGYDQDNNKVVSSVPGYKSFFDRYLEKGADPRDGGVVNHSRMWITPREITLKKDDLASAFVFETATMQVKHEPLNPDNYPTWNAAAEEFVQHQTDHYDLYAQETPAYAEAKQLGKVVAVIKWLADNGIATDFQWARDYTVKSVPTSRQMPQLTTPWVDGGNGYDYQLTGGVDYLTPNTYNSDSGISADLKTSSQANSAAKEDIHWTFTKDEQTYEAVAVAADAFRSLGSYTTSVTDMSFPTAGDLTLAFNRTYSSYSGGQHGMGRGWNIQPATLYDNDPLQEMTCNGAQHPRSLALISQGGGFESFTMADCNVGYVADDPAYHSQVFSNADGTFTARLKDQTELNFNATYQLTTIKDKNSNALTYAYNGSGKLTNIADSKGHVITLAYSAQNLIESATDWSDRAVRYGYDAENRLIRVTDPNGEITTYAYDADGRLTVVTDREGTVLVTNTYTDGAKVATQKNAANLTTTHTYDHVNRVITSTDNLGRSVKTTYDAKARVLEQADPLNQKVMYTYGVELAPLTVKDKNGNTVSSTYDGNGNLTLVIYPDAKKVTYQYDSKNRLTRVVDERYGMPGRETKNTYDALGNLTQVSDAGVISGYAYDATGELLTATDALNHVTGWTRDAFGNKATEKDALNNTTAFTYDAVERLTRRMDADGKSVAYTYDPNGNLLTQTDAVGTATHNYDKEGRLLKTTLPNTKVITYSYNPVGSLVGVKDQLLNLTAYGYDAYQNLTSQQDALNKLTNYTYDELNRQKQATTPLDNATKWEYDPNGNISKRTDANGAVTTYVYDALNRVTQISYPDTTKVTFEYDGRGNMTKMIDPVGTSTFVYDNFDRQTQFTNAYGYKLSYEYDAVGNRKKMTYPDGSAAVYTYDNNNRLKSVTDWNLKITSYTYNKNGLLATRLYPNAVQTAYTYDAANRLQEIVHSKSTTVLAKFTHERDSVGNITKATESGSYISSTPQITTYSYDALGRLTNAVYPGSKTYAYTYDAVGNRLNQNDSGTQTAYTYDNDYRLTKANTINYFSDANGNLTSHTSIALGNAQFGYNFDDKLTKYVLPNGNTHLYTLDGLGNRVRKYFDTAIKYYVTDITGPYPRVVLDSTSNPILYGAGVISEGLKSYSARYYYLEDGIGNTRLLTSYSGSKSGVRAYDPFGNTRTYSLKTPLFQMHEEGVDSESGLYYLNARHYFPEIGRFISRDPVKGSLTNPQSQHPYAYGYNNPVNNSDPSGKLVPEVAAFAAWASLLPLMAGGAVGGATVYLEENWGCANVGDLALYAAGGAQAAEESWLGQLALGGGYILGSLSTPGGSSQTQYHGNDLRNPATNYGYSLKNVTTGAIEKYGETLYPDSRYPASWLQENNLMLQVETIGSKLDIHNWQHDKIQEFMNLNSGSMPIRNFNGY